MVDRFSQGRRPKRPFTRPISLQSDPPTLPVRNQSGRSTPLHRLLCWSFWQSFHQALLNRTRPDSTESLPNLTWPDRTGP
jgi:hypothetical protein